VANKTKNKKIFFQIAFYALVVFGTLLPRVSFANGWTTLKNYTFLLFGYIFAFILEIETFFFVLSGKLFDHVYHNAPDIINDPVVIAGWGITRDVLNMFFVISLLVIAFATILRIEAYQYKALLPKLIYAALLVNFSKTIAGVFIDFSNVLMMTFINFKGYNYSDTFSLALFNTMPHKIAGSAWSSLEPGSNVVTEASIAILATIFVMFLIMMAFSLLSTLIIMRNVVLMVLVVLSPAAFVLNILPATQQYAKRWWDEFFKYVFYGPVAGFLVYLSCMVAYHITEDTTSKGILMKVKTTGELRGNISLLTADGFYRMAVMITFLYLAILMAKALSPMAAGMTMGLARRGMGLATKVGLGAAMLGGNFARRTALRAGKGRMAQGVSALNKGLMGKGIVGKALGAVSTLPLHLLAQGAGLAARGAATATMIPEAWRTRRARLESDAYTQPGGQMHDMLNNVMSLGHEKTNYARRARRSLEVEKENEIGTESSPALVDGYMGAANEIEKGAHLRKLAGTNNLNDLLSLPAFFDKHREAFMKMGIKKEDGTDLVTKDSKPEFDPQLLKKALQLELGEGSLACQTVADLQEITLAAGHFGTAGMVTNDKGKWRYTTDAEQEEIVEDKKAKMGNRAYMGDMHSNAIVRESAGKLKDVHQAGWYLLEHEDREKAARVGEYGRGDPLKAYMAINSKGERNLDTIKKRAVEQIKPAFVKKLADALAKSTRELEDLGKAIKGSKGKKRQGLIKEEQEKSRKVATQTESNNSHVERMAVMYGKACEMERLGTGKVTDHTGAVVPPTPTDGKWGIGRNVIEWAGDHVTNMAAGFAAGATP